MGKLEGKVALVTGGSSGIGRAIANRFAAEGAFVYVVGRRESELADVVAEIGGNAVAIRADITELDQLDAVYARISNDGRKLDVVVANAGMQESVRSLTRMRRISTAPLVSTCARHFSQCKRRCRS